VTDTKPTVFIVDDDPSIRESTEMLLRSVGIRVKTFVSAQDFLKTDLREGFGCLVLDVRMPGMSGLQLQEKLVSAKTPLPVIFITGHGTIPMSVRAMKAGAVDFIPKPFDEQELLDAINRAISQQKEREAKNEEIERLHRHLKTLTTREYEVFSLLVTGMANKEIAYELGTSERTVKAHRAKIMEKMYAGSLADLIRFSEKLKTNPPD
jgi:RNA polymerase sigma factor (sigma-70 family)